MRKPAMTKRRAQRMLDFILQVSEYMTTRQVLPVWYVEHMDSLDFIRDIALHKLGKEIPERSVVSESEVADVRGQQKLFEVGA